MSKPLVDRIPFAKIVTVLAIGFGVALGLCGLTGALSTMARGNVGFLGPLVIIELGAMLLCAVGLVLTVVVWVVAAIIDKSTHKGSDPRRLFDDDSDSRNEK